jgi:hypothetical protein
LLHDACEAAIVQIDVVLHAALPAERESYALAVDLDMPIAHGCEPVRAIRSSVFVVAHPDQGLLEQPHHRGEHFLARQTGTPQIVGRLPAHARQRLREPNEPVIFRLVSNDPPFRVIAILLAAARIASGRLEMAARIRTDPDVRPRRGDYERADTAEF